jgi:hypothetical protein
VQKHPRFCSLVRTTKKQLVWCAQPVNRPYPIRTYTCKIRCRVCAIVGSPGRRGPVCRRAGARRSRDHLARLPCRTAAVEGRPKHSPCRCCRRFHVRHLYGLVFLINLRGLWCLSSPAYVMVVTADLWTKSSVHSVSMIKLFTHIPPSKCLQNNYCLK